LFDIPCGVDDDLYCLSTYRRERLFSLSVPFVPLLRPSFPSLRVLLPSQRREDLWGCDVRNRDRRRFSTVHVTANALGVITP